MRRADHHRVGAAGDRLGDVAAGAHAAVGDHVAVAAGLVQVLAARGRSIGDRGGLGHADPEHATGGARVAGADPDQHTDRARAHQVQGGGVGRAPAHDDGDVEAGDELLQVERLGAAGDMLRPRRPCPGSPGRRDRLPARARRTARPAAGVSEAHETTPPALISSIRLPDQLGLDRLGVELLHAPGGLLVARAS